MLKLDEEFGNITDLSNLNDVQNINKRIHTIMTTNIITGDNNILNNGDYNHISLNIQKGDFSTVRQALSEHEVAEVDISDLEKVINEKPDVKKKAFGEGVNKWIRKMLDKTIDGTWKVGIGAAGKLLSDAISAYYGF